MGRAHVTGSSTATALYLNAQADAGAQALQLFDSWVGNLGPDDYTPVRPAPHAPAVLMGSTPSVPAIHFGTDTGSLLELQRDAGGDVIGLDWRVDLGEAWDRLGPGVAVQGNLDPAVLFGPECRRSRARRGGSSTRPRAARPHLQPRPRHPAEHAGAQCARAGG